ncbi:MAG TPA: hypothetical protein VIE39_06595, partial [Thermoanaerobaculia bacterium]
MSRSFRGVLTLAAGLLAATPRPVPAQANQLASASHPFLTVGVGVGGILVAQSGSGPEILITHFAQGDSGWQNNQWSALRPDGRGGYRPVFTSEIQPGNIRELLAGDVIGDARREVVLFLSTGQIVLHDLSSKALIGQFPAAFPADGILAADLEDLNGDGKSELLIVSEDELKVYDGGGALLWGATSGGTDV